MITFDIITIFPKIFDSFLKESLIAKARERRLIKVNIHNLRDWAADKHKSVDDKPFGGGIGMVMKVEPIYKAVESLKSKSGGRRTKIILFSPRGKKFTQQMAYKLSKADRIIMICGRYEGVDERVTKYIADEEISVGDYVLMGGELPSMVTMEAIARLTPGVIGKPQLLKERITKEKGFVEYPQYTRPEVFSPLPPLIKCGGKLEKRIKWQAPKVLLSGNHREIEQWRKKYGRAIGR